MFEEASFAKFPCLIGKMDRTLCGYFEQMNALKYSVGKVQNALTLSTKID